MNKEEFVIKLAELYKDSEGMVEILQINSIRGHIKAAIGMLDVQKSLELEKKDVNAMMQGPSRFGTTPPRRKKKQVVKHQSLPVVAATDKEEEAPKVDSTKKVEAKEEVKQDPKKGGELTKAQQEAIAQHPASGLLSKLVGKTAEELAKKYPGGEGAQLRALATQIGVTIKNSVKKPETIAQKIVEGIENILDV